MFVVCCTGVQKVAEYKRCGDTQSGSSASRLQDCANKCKTLSDFTGDFFFGRQGSYSCTSSTICRCKCGITGCKDPGHSGYYDWYTTDEGGSIINFFEYTVEPCNSGHHSFSKKVFAIEGVRYKKVNFNRKLQFGSPKRSPL